MLIGNSISLFKQKGQNLQNDLHLFGEKLIDTMSKNQVEKLFMDTDYQDRTVLHLITKYGYEPLCRDPKIKILLDELWVGKESYACDG